MSIRDKSFKSGGIAESAAGHIFSFEAAFKLRVGEELQLICFHIRPYEAGKLVDPRLSKVFAGLINTMLQDDEEAWDRLVRRASQFTQDYEESGGPLRET